MLQPRPGTGKNNLKDCWSQIPITNIKIMKMLEMCELPYIDTKWANAIGKLALIDLLGAGLPQTFGWYETALQSTIKGSTIKYACMALTHKMLSSFSFDLCLSYLCYLVSKYLEFFQGTLCTDFQFTHSGQKHTSCISNPVLSRMVYLLYLGKYALCTWKECGFCCFWLENSIRSN